VPRHGIDVGVAGAAHDQVIIAGSNSRRPSTISTKLGTFFGVATFV
jgi:hypothetical protein